MDQGEPPAGPERRGRSLAPLAQGVRGATAAEPSFKSHFGGVEGALETVSGLIWAEPSPELSHGSPSCRRPRRLLGDFRRRICPAAGSSGAALPGRRAALVRGGAAGAAAACPGT